MSESTSIDRLDLRRELEMCRRVLLHRAAQSSALGAKSASTDLYARAERVDQLIALFCPAGAP